MSLRHRLGKIFNLRARKPTVSSRNSTAGFTLTELLVVVAIAGVIVSALMALVVELIGTEQRESVRTETQRSMQLALNYIAADLKQAVYIYGDEANPQDITSVPSYMKYLPDEYDDEDFRPVLAFWKPRSIDLENLVANGSGLPAYDDCATTFDDNDDATEVRLRRECQSIWKQRRAYSLVVYFQVPKGVRNADGKWKGESRIARYELFKYNNLTDANAADVFDRTPGFVDPAELGSDAFQSWPWSGTEDCQADSCVEDLADPGAPLYGAGPAVLVDFVDDPGAARASEPTTCENLGATAGDYKRVPSADAGYAKVSNSFFVCLRDTSGVLGEAQDVIVYLRGNAKGRGGANSDAFLPTMQTRVTMRGIIDKNVGGAAVTSP